MIDEEIDAGVPILRLPADITTEIFNLIIGLDIDTLPDDIEDHVLPLTPLNLGAVCRSWRTFVWETPSFWAVIVLTLRDERCNNQIDILELWLRNSGAYPLEISFDPRLSHSSDYNDLFNGTHSDYGPSIVALRNLVEQSGRWKRFSTHIIHDEEFIDVLRQVKGRIPLLQSGRLNLQFNKTKMDMFENAPLLKEFTMINSATKPPNDYVLLPWRQLTSFHGKHLDEEECIAVLSLCANLFECVFSNVVALTEDLDGKIISVPRLRSLSISSASAGGIGILLRNIRCPKLHRLHLSEGAWGLPYAQLEEFINQSNCDLKVLHFENLSVLSSVLPFLESLPSLQSLIVQHGLVACFHSQRGSQTNVWSKTEPWLMFEFPRCDHDDTDFFFDSLLTKLDLTTTTISTFLPNLAELHTRILLPRPSYRHQLVPGTSLNLLKVLQQRWNPPEGVAKLQKVFVEDTLTLDESDDGSVIDGLRDLMRKGMKIAVPGL